jgi:hypothetical protein
MEKVPVGKSIIERELMKVSSMKKVLPMYSALTAS